MLVLVHLHRQRAVGVAQIDRPWNGRPCLHLPKEQTHLRLACYSTCPFVLWPSYQRGNEPVSHDHQRSLVQLPSRCPETFRPKHPAGSCIDEQSCVGEGRGSAFEEEEVQAYDVDVCVFDSFDASSFDTDERFDAQAA